jgi:chemotaxis family two-component system response regulator PixG
MLAVKMMEKTLLEQLEQFSTERFTGCLDIQLGSDPTWSLYFCVGRLVWQTGGAHAVDRWRRLLTQYCPQVTEADLAAIPVPSTHCRDYKVLTGLLRQNKISREAMLNLIETALTEVLFDLVQAREACILREQGSCQLRLTQDTQVRLEEPITFYKMEQIALKVQEQWQSWQAAGFAGYSPNLVPALHFPTLFQQQVSAPNFQVLSQLIDGKHTLRSLALKMRQDTLSLLHSLIPYVKTGSIKWVDPQISPQQNPTTEVSRKPLQIPALPVAKSEPATSQPLLVCIDDSPTVCKTLETIASQNHCRFLGIQSSIQAIPLLLKHKPDLIFLDLVMPVANGYEICAQIRRISSLKEVPVVTLTGNDGIVDRMRAKMVGSTDFLAKPVDEAKVVGMIQKFLLGVIA